MDATDILASITFVKGRSIGVNNPNMFLEEMPVAFVDSKLADKGNGVVRQIDLGSDSITLYGNPPGGLTAGDWIGLA